MAGAPAVLQLPWDRVRPAERDTSASLSFGLDPALTRDLQELGRRHGVTLFMTLLSAWAALAGRLSGQDSVVIGTPVAGRTRVEVESLIGFFVNTLPIRVDLTGGLTPRDLVRHVKTQVLSAQAHQDLPFEQIVEVVQPPRSLAHTPLFQVMLSWQNPSEGEFGMPGLRLSPLGSGNPSAKFDLDFELQQTADSIAGVLTYATALFDEASVQRFLGYFERLLRAFVADDAQPLQRSHCSELSSGSGCCSR